jgi:hypothetical protein
MFRKTLSKAKKVLAEKAEESIDYVAHDVEVLQQ